MTFDSELIQDLVDSELERAEQVWDAVGDRLSKAFVKDAMQEGKEWLPSNVPGYELVRPGVPEVDQFIAIVVDMRDSTSRLMQAISKKRAAVSQLQRVFYETSAFLGPCAELISGEGGKVTEYLGDGLLGFFLASPEQRDGARRAAYRSAKYCLRAVKEIINPTLERRYRLPAIRLGIGLAFDQAIVTPVGGPSFRQVKAFGKCVYIASKLSAWGENQIFVDEAIESMWPATPDGKMRFEPHERGGIKGFLMNRGGSS